MKNHKGLPEMGVVVCVNCDCVIETFSTSKVTTYYSVCEHEDCSLTTLEGNEQVAGD